MAKSNLAKSLYKSLFGARGPVDGSVIDLAEHGRAGGISTGQGYKNTKYVEEALLLDEPTSNLKYIGRALPGSGTDTSSAIWQIQKFEVSGSVTSILYADGDDNYDNIWDNRASLSYS